MCREGIAISDAVRCPSERDYVCGVWRGQSAESRARGQYQFEAGPDDSPRKTRKVTEGKKHQTLRDRISSCSTNAVPDGDLWQLLRFRTTHVSLLVGLRKFVCFQVAFIAPREESRSRVRCRSVKSPFIRTRRTSRGARKATWVAAKGRAVLLTFRFYARREELW